MEYQETEEDGEEFTKGVLLDCLGNAALQRSFHHIKAHAIPNLGYASWRIHAVGAMRHYKHQEVRALLMYLGKISKTKCITF